MSAYAVNWEAKNYSDFVIPAAKALLLFAIIKRGGALTRLLLAKMGFITDGNALFNSAKRVAKMTGELLGCALSIGYPFYTQSVSLIGFSLGCQVVKSALKTLHAFGAHNVVQNVTFMGAAVDVLDKPKIEQRWVNIFASTVSGTIKNVYTKWDVILLLYSASQHDFSLGRNPVFNKKT